MNNLMLKFLQRYKSNTTSATILNQDTTLDYYDVSYRASIVDAYSPSLDITEYDGTCKVSIEEFAKFKNIEEAVIW